MTSSAQRRGPVVAPSAQGGTSVVGRPSGGSGPGESTVSPLSLAAHRKLPLRRNGSSHSLGWRSVLARSYHDPVEAEAFSTAPTPDLLVAISLRGTVTVECERPSGWTKATLRPGGVGVTSPGTSSTLRWRGGTPGLASLHLHLSAVLLAETAEALDSPRLAEQLPNALLLEDATVLSIARALGVGLEQGAEPLYADSLAQALVAHMLYGRLLGGRPQPDPAPRMAGSALRRVLEHMHDHIAEELTLDSLADVAGLSRYQLIRTFKRTLGITPHRHVMAMRMRRGAELLTRTDHSVAQISSLCGYASPGQFITAFGRLYGTSPARYRQSMKNQHRM